MRTSSGQDGNEAMGMDPLRLAQVDDPIPTEDSVPEAICKAMLKGFAGGAVSGIVIRGARSASSPTASSRATSASSSAPSAPHRGKFVHDCDVVSRGTQGQRVNRAERLSQLAELLAKRVL